MINKRCRQHSSDITTETLQYLHLYLLHVCICAQGDAHFAPIRVQHKFEGAEEEFTSVTQDVTVTDETVDSVTVAAADAADTSAAVGSTDMNSSDSNNNVSTDANSGQWGWGQGVTAAKKQRNTNNTTGMCSLFSW
jgi:hypothetical protein